MKGRLCWSSCPNWFVQISDEKKNADIAKLLALYRWRRMATWFSQPREANPSSSSYLSLRLLLLQQLLQPRHQLQAIRQLVVAAVTVAQLQEPAATSGQLPARILLDCLPVAHFVTPSPTSRRRRVMSLGRGETCPGGRGERERLFGSRKREGKLTITFPFYGKRNFKS